MARAKSLLSLSEERWALIENAEVKKFAAVITSNAYQPLLEVCEAVLFAKGFKSYSHECVTAFLKEQLDEHKIARVFDRYRKIRIGINYYGESVDPNTAEAALKEIRVIMDELKGKYLSGLGLKTKSKTSMTTGTSPSA